jgi:hypothetical protein
MKVGMVLKRIRRYLKIANYNSLFCKCSNIWVRVAWNSYTFIMLRDCIYLYLSVPVAPIWSIEHPWNALLHFSFLILYTVGRTPWAGNSPAQGRYLHRTKQTEWTQTDIDALSGIRTHDTSVRQGGNFSWRRPRGHCDRLLTVYNVVIHSITTCYVYGNISIAFIGCTTSTNFNRKLI